MDNNAEMVETFKSMTGADDAFARGFLEANGWNLEMACSNFFEGGGGGASSSSASAGPGYPTSSQSSGTNPPGVTDEMIAKIVSEMGVSVADARAIAQAQGPSPGAAMEEDNVRAPIAATQGRLFDSGFAEAAQFMDGSRVNQVNSFRNFEQEARQLEAEKRNAAKKRLEATKDSLGTASAAYAYEEQSNKNSNGMNDDDDDDYDYDYDDDEEDEEMGNSSSAATSSRDQNLKSLFRPPQDMLFTGGFDQAKIRGKEKKKWILVNIQDDAEFFSYVLNRDLWSAEIVQDVIRENFVFFQRDRNDDDAVTVARYYKPQIFPHVAIIDPVTGAEEEILDLKGRGATSDPFILQSSFLDKISAFLQKHNPDTRPSTTPPPAPSASHNDTDQDSGGQINLAASGQTSAPSGRTLGGTSAPVSSGSGTLIQYEALQDEPDKSDSNAMQVRIRLFDGKTVNRTFLATQKVSQLSALVHSMVPDTETRAFEMVKMGFPPKSLKDAGDQTFAEAGLQRANLTAKWLA